MKLNFKMKLNSKVTFTYIVISSVLFLIGGIILYQYIRKEVDEKVDWKLYANKDRILEAAKDSESRHSRRSIYRAASSIAERYIEIDRYKCDPVLYEDEIKDTLLPSFLYGGVVQTPYRQLKFYTTVNDRTYRVILRNLLVEPADLREGIVNSLLYVFIALFIILIVTNYFISRRIWRPFYKTVNTIGQFNFAGKQTLNLPKTGVNEFTELNTTINNMSKKISQDFISLKEFTENASHEIQTPLAIIKSKLELLIQSENLNKELSVDIMDINNAVAKLSKINQSLILITKIENSQFSKKEEVNINSVIDKILYNYSDLIKAKDLKLETSFDPDVIHYMDQTLAEILLSNIIINSIKHNINNGKINIKLTGKEFSISNTGDPLNCEPEKLFKRFQKIHRSSDSLGLGLAIVKSICDFYNMEITYSYENKEHLINIRF